MVLKHANEIRLFRQINSSSSTKILLVGIKYCMFDPVCEINYWPLLTTLRYGMDHKVYWCQTEHPSCISFRILWNPLDS